MTIRDTIHSLLRHAIEGARTDSVFALPKDIPLTMPDHATHGDYTTSIALTLAKEWREAPRAVAERIQAAITNPAIERVEIAGPGFLNFFVRPEMLWKKLPTVIKAGESFGASKIGKKEKVVVEFISANPTGPLTLANARGGFFGDTLSNVLALTGHRVQREYYVNDAGNQVRTLGESVLAAIGEAASSEKHYQGPYIRSWAVAHRAELKGRDPSDVGKQYADEILATLVKPPIEKMGIRFDRWFHESVLHRAVSGKQKAVSTSAIDTALQLLKKKGHVYVQDGATWFRTTTFGDDKDRVLVTSDGYPTYYLADIAHYMVIRKEGWKRYINFLGADHHGYVGRVQAAAGALGYDRIDVIILQLVKLMSGGVEVRMSKRRGTYITIEDLLEEIPVDVARFFFLMYAPTSHLDFDLDRAKEQSSKNPVYYVQYAYTRLTQILKKAEGLPPHPGPSPQGEGKGEVAPAAELSLLKYLFRWPELVEDVSRTYEVHRIPAFALKLADHLHAFYDSCRVIEGDRVHKHRLMLVRAAHAVFGSILKTMGISRPERM